jgi:hypothetical protein
MSQTAEFRAAVVWTWRCKLTAKHAAVSPGLLAQTTRCSWHRWEPSVCTGLGPDGAGSVKDSNLNLNMSVFLGLFFVARKNSFVVAPVLRSRHSHKKECDTTCALQVYWGSPVGASNVKSVSDVLRASLNDSFKYCWYLRVDMNMYY